MNVNETLLVKTSYDGLDAESSISFSSSKDLSDAIEERRRKIEEIDQKIEKLSFKGDRADIIIAASSGFLCGLVDVIFLSQIDLTKCQKLGQAVVEPIIKKMGGSNDLAKAVSNLEKRTKRSFASDPNYADFGGGLQHHLRDFAHHFSPLGLFFSVLTQFTGKCYGTDTAGKFLVTDVIDKTRIGTTFTQKLSFGFIDWFFHLASDMVGTSKNVGRGTGIPGPILSLAKELSTILPKGKDGESKLSKLISQMFNGTFFAEHDNIGKIIPGTEKPLDFRTEIGLTIFESIPVLLNMICVRGFYFVRRFIQEMRKKKTNNQYRPNWKNVSPFGNTTIVRMTTVANCSFEAVDLVGASINSLIKSGANLYAFIGNMLINVNILGIGKMAFSLSKEVFIGIKKHTLKKEKSKELVELTNLNRARVYYYLNDSWREIKETEAVMKQLEKTVQNTSDMFRTYCINIQHNLDSIENDLKDNDDLRQYIADGLEN